MATKKKRSRTRRTGCHCPAGSRRLTTKGRGRGWVCQSSKPKKVRRRIVKKPFVKAVC